MLELSEFVLRRGYTLFISKRRYTAKIQGTYSKYLADGLHFSELPLEELKPLQKLPNIMEHLSRGEILQISMPEYPFEGIIGSMKTESTYCEKGYLEVHEESKDYNLHKMLVELDTKLSITQRHESAQDAVQYKKLYKGESRYE